MRSFNSERDIAIRVPATPPTTHQCHRRRPNQGLVKYPG